MFIDMQTLRLLFASAHLDLLLDERIFLLVPLLQEGSSMVATVNALASLHVVLSLVP